LWRVRFAIGYSRYGDAGAGAVGSNEVGANFCAGDIGAAVACIGVSEPGAGSTSLDQTMPRRCGDLRHQWRQDVDHHGVQADWICLLANTATNRSIATSR